jgi:hypothetical protein
MIFSSDKTDLLLDAIRDFTENYPDDRAAIIATNEITLSSLLNIWILFFFWDGNEPSPGTFDGFTKIGPDINTCGPTTYYNYLTESNAAVLTGQVYAITTETTPLPNKTVGHEVFRSYYDHFNDVAMAHKDVPGLIATIAFQPLPKRLVQKSQANGGDLLDLDDSIDRIVFEFDYSYSFPAADLLMDEAIVTLYSGLRDRVKAFIADGTLPNAYLPLFMNDANYQQDFFGRLRPETLEYARDMRDAYDPKGFFRDRTGGFKL